MSTPHLIHWNIADDVLGLDKYEEYFPQQEYRTIIASTSARLPQGSIALCAQYDDSGRGHIVLAIGRIAGKKPVSTRRRVVRLEPFIALSTSLDVDLFRGELDHHVCRALDDAVSSDSLYPKLFTPRSKDLLLSIISNASHEASQVLASLYQEKSRVPGLDGRRLREERDAVATAFELAELTMPTQSYVERSRLIRPTEPFAVSGLPMSSLINEDDLITYDLARFDGEVRPHILSPAAYTVTDNDVRLTIINVNRKPLEQVLGVDLVYYDRIREQVTAVQYKRLERRKDVRNRTVWIYRRKEELLRQLSLMSQPPRSLARSSTDWRITPSPTFFKFVRDEDYDPMNQGVLQGMYVPSEYLELGIKDGTFDTGVRGGFQVGSHNARYLTRRVFVELVRRGWIGTVKTDESAIYDKVAEMAEYHEVVFATRSHVSEQSRSV